MYTRSEIDEFSQERLACAKSTSEGVGWEETLGVAIPALRARVLRRTLQRFLSRSRSWCAPPCPISCCVASRNDSFTSASFHWGGEGGIFSRTTTRVPKVDPPWAISFVLRLIFLVGLLIELMREK